MDHGVSPPHQPKIHYIQRLENLPHSSTKFLLPLQHQKSIPPNWITIFKL